MVQKRVLALQHIGIDPPGYLGELLQDRLWDHLTLRCLPFHRCAKRGNSPAFRGRSWGLVPGMPLPSTAGLLMPSLNPKASRPVGNK